MFKELCLASSIRKGFIYTFLFTLPMLIGYAAFGQYNSDENILSFLRKNILPGFMEEVLYIEDSCLDYYFGNWVGTSYLQGS